jgi:hypothetical protein
MKLKLIAVLWVGWILAACAGGGGGGGGGMGDIRGNDDGAVGGISEVPNPSQAMASASGKPLSRLQRGHEIYMLKCGECHEYMLPERVDIEDWEDAMPQMIRHAGLPTADEGAVLDYVIAVKAQKG